MNNKKSQKLFHQANQVIPGGVNSPVRAFKSAGGIPPYIVKAAGSKVWDIDDNEYIDYMASWGSMILGHAHLEVVEAVKKTAEKGPSYGANCEIEVIKNSSFELHNIFPPLAAVPFLDLPPKTFRCSRL